MFVISFIEIRSLSKEISCNAKLPNRRTTSGGGGTGMKIKAYVTEGDDK